MFHSVNGEKEKKGGKKKEMIDLEKMHEKNLYPAVEKFLKTQKNCLSEYVGSELSQKREKTRLRVERIAEEMGLVDKLKELRRRVEEERGDEIKGTLVFYGRWVRRWEGDMESMERGRIEVDLTFCPSLLFT